MSIGYRCSIEYVKQLGLTFHAYTKILTDKDAMQSTWHLDTQ